MLGLETNLCSFGATETHPAHSKSKSRQQNRYMEDLIPASVAKGIGKISPFIGNLPTEFATELKGSRRGRRLEQARVCAQER
jgi:hypothetical protein